MEFDHDFGFRVVLTYFYMLGGGASSGEDDKNIYRGEEERMGYIKKMVSPKFAPRD